MRRGIRTTVGLVSATAVFTTGCYRFTPAETASLGPGTTVRLHLTDDGSAAMTTIVGPRVELLDGMLAEFLGDSLVVLRLQEATSRGGSVTEWAGESVRVPRRAIASAERKERSPQRTAIVAAAIVAGVIAIASGFNLFGSTSGKRGTDGSTPK